MATIPIEPKGRPRQARFQKLPAYFREQIARGRSVGALEAELGELSRATRPQAKGAAQEISCQVRRCGLVDRPHCVAMRNDPRVFTNIIRHRVGREGPSKAIQHRSWNRGLGGEKLGDPRGVTDRRVNPSIHVVANGVPRGAQGLKNGPRPELLHSPWREVTSSRRQHCCKRGGLNAPVLRRSEGLVNGVQLRPERRFSYKFGTTGQSCATKSRLMSSSLRLSLQRQARRACALQDASEPPRYRGAEPALPGDAAKPTGPIAPRRKRACPHPPDRDCPIRTRRIARRDSRRAQLPPWRQPLGRSAPVSPRTRHAEIVIAS